MIKKTVRPSRVLLYAVLILFSIAFLIPMYMTVLTSLKNPAEINLLTAWKLPSRLYFESYVKAWQLLGPNIKNSLILTFSATVISAFVGSLNGYVFSKNKFRYSELIFTLILFGMFIPYQIILIPLFRVLRQIGLYGSLGGLVLAHVVYGIPIVTLLFRNFYDQIPNEIMESAKLDGAGYFPIYGKIILPLSIPGFVTVGLWQVTQIWNEFLWGITLTRQASNPITVGLSKLAGGQAVSWNLPMAGALITALPVLIIYVFLGKYFIRGLLSGSVKG
ncbi:MAG: glucose/mannose transport system permease protein [Verrucomicrobiota bacterium]|jgi:glucose/mannose transport system permease protein|nr:glucose/mannose transport system permease protein [Verrucomicrobiota bacterium]MDK2963435.1 glucose/mannose transport system permease protein [Verrucomicrobiota bacterium]